MSKKQKRSDKNEGYWKDLADIVSVMKRFQVEGPRARVKAGFPESGLPKSERVAWYQACFKNPDIDIKKEYGSRSTLALLPPNRKFIEALVWLARRFNLDSRWYSSIFFYLTGSDDRLEPPFPRAEVGAEINDARLPEDKWVVKRLWINVEKDTSLEDIAEVWVRVEKYQKMIEGDWPTKRRPFKNVKKYLKVRKLEKNHTQKQIAEDYKELGFNINTDVAAFKRSMEKHFKAQPKPIKSIYDTLSLR